MRYLLCFFVLTTIPMMGNDFPHFNPQTIEQFEGEILSVQTFSYANRPSPHVQVIMRTEEGNIPIEMGPEWYIEAEGFTLTPGEMIKVKGSRIQVNSHPLIIATDIEKDDYLLKLRNENGLPQWAGWRRSETFSENAS